MKYYSDILRALDNPLAFAGLIILIAGSVWFLLGKKSALAKWNMALVALMMLLAVGIAVYFFDKQKNKGKDESIAYHSDTIRSIEQPRLPRRPTPVPIKKIGIPDSKNGTVTASPAAVFHCSGLIKDAISGMPLAKATLTYWNQVGSSRVDGTFDVDFEIQESGERIQVGISSPGYKTASYSFFREGQNQIILLEKL